MKTSITIACLLLATTVESQHLGNRHRRVGTQRPFITRDLERAVKRGLEFLAAEQDVNGYWVQHVGFKLNVDYEITTRHAGHVGVTSLALMSFLAGGHVPGRGKYGKVLDRGLKYILSSVRENGFIQDNGSRMYSHAFASLLLAEIYGMTRRRDVRDALQRAVTVIVDSQNSQGGWRYQLFARESDMSITVCQVMALRSARNVGITVPKSSIEAAERYVQLSSVQGGRRNRFNSWQAHSHGIVNTGGAFRYQPRNNARATFPLTAAGVTTLFAAGNYNSPLINPALEYLHNQMPMFNRAFGRRGHYFYYYGHYYAVQAFFVAGDPHWTQYFRRMKKELLDNQRDNGSWPCSVGPGAAFATAVSTLILQIPYQYLPIFQR